jgi:hypothetical protein
VVVTVATLALPGSGYSIAEFEDPTSVAAGRDGSLLVATPRPVRARESVPTVAVRLKPGTSTPNVVERDAGSEHQRTTATTVGR